MSEFNIVNDSPYVSNWFGSADEKSADYELEEDLSLIRLRQSSKKLIKNNFIAAGIQQTYINTVIGGSVKLDLETKAVNQYDKTFEVLDEMSKTLDIERKMNVTALAEILVANSFQDGDVLINLPLDAKGETYVELVDASRIRTRPKDANNPLVVEGVEYYENGSVKGYWITKVNKKKRTFYYYRDEDFDFYPRRKKYKSGSRVVCDLFKAPLNLRVGQTRQYPLLTPLMELLRYKNQYLEAVLIGARVAACFSGFVKTNNPARAQKSLEDGITNGSKLTKLKPGTLSYLKPNEDITFAAPNKPSDNFDSFLLRLCKLIGMTMRIPYAMLFLDLSETTYSSWKGGSFEVERNVNRWREELNKTIVWILKTKLVEAKSKKLINVSLKGLTLSLRFPKFKVVDEEKTARANRLDLENKITSKRRISDETGHDFEELQRELTEEMEIETRREAERLKLQQELEEELGIFFPESETRERGSKFTEEEKIDRRKDDGNW